MQNIRSSRHVLVILLLLVAAIGMSHCEQAPSGSKANADQPRLAVLSPALAIILDDLGRSEAIVGRHGFDFVLSEQIPVVGNQMGIDYEVLIRTDPTHILLEQNREGIPDRLAKLAMSRGWTIEVFPLLTLDDIPSAVRRLDHLLAAGDSPMQSDAARELLRRMNESWSHHPQLASRLGRTLILAWTEPAGAMGPGSFHYQLLQRLGASCLPLEGTPYVSLSSEDLIRLDPDSIILFAPGAKAATAQELLGPIDRLDLRAERQGRILVIRDDLSLTPSTAMIDVAEQIVHQSLLLAPLTN